MRLENTKANFMKSRRGFLQSIILAVSTLALSSMAQAQAVTEYEVVWDFPALPFEVSTLQLQLTEKLRVAEFGELLKETRLPIQKKLTDGKFMLRAGEQAILAIVVKNLGNKEVRFSVAPHSTQPGASALGFHFNCLCNGHVYIVPAGKTWYRIMSLQSLPSESSEHVLLRHKIYVVKK